MDEVRKFKLWLYFHESSLTGRIDWSMLLEDPDQRRSLYVWTADDQERAVLEAICVAIDLVGKGPTIYVDGCDARTFPLLASFRKSSLKERNPSYGFFRKNLDLWSVYSWKKVGNRIRIINPIDESDFSMPDCSNMKGLSVSDLYRGRGQSLPRWLKY